MVNGVGMQLRILNQNPGGTNEFNKAEGTRAEQ